MNITELFLRGSKLLAAEHTLSELDKTGTWRGGSSGCLVFKDSTMGVCGRLALLRHRGVEISPEDGTSGKSLMWSMGVLNEDDWFTKLRRGWGGDILREEEIPIHWHTKKGTSVTGRPDLVLTNQEGQPVYGIELKQLASLWTSRDTGLEMRPKTEHLVQAAHYAWKLGIPYSLVYTNRVNFAVPNIGWAQKLFPSQTETVNTVLEDRIAYKTGTDSEGNPYVYVKDILPFIQEYQLSWQEGQLFFREVFPDSEPLAWRSTIITQQGIETFYDSLESGVLPPKPSKFEFDGKMSNFKKCDYCDLKPVCFSKKNFELDEWFSAVTKSLQK